MTVRFEFKTPEEQNAFVRLLYHIPRFETWDQARYAPGETCHICKSKEQVKSGVVSCDNFFNPEMSEKYTFWICCQACNYRGWNIPSRIFGDSITYWKPDEVESKYEEIVVTDLKLFGFPSVLLHNNDVLVSIDS